MKKILVLTTALTLFTIKGFTQVISIHCDTLQNFRYVGHEDPIVKLALEETELPTFTLEEREFVFDFDRMELLRDGEVITTIKKLIYNKDDVFFTYNPLKDDYEGYGLITDGMNEDVPRRVILFWETSKTHTIGSFGYLD